jgi:Leucine rich repeat
MDRKQITKALLFIQSSFAGSSDRPNHVSIRAETLQRASRLFRVLVESVNRGSPGAGSTDEQQQAYLRANLDALKTNVLAEVTSLHCYSSDVPDLHYFALSCCPNLAELRLDMCPPSTVEDLFFLHKQLKVLEITNSGICDLSKLLIPLISQKQLITYRPMILPDTSTAQNAQMDLDQKYAWHQLTTLTLSNCGLARLDATFHFFPSVVRLDVSHNDFNHIMHLQDCYNLQYLNLSHNRIRCLSNSERVLGNILSLNLSNNAIQCLDGIDKIYSLQFLDVSSNIIDDFSEVQYLNKLPNLEGVRMEDNPIASHPTFRLLFYQHFIFDGSAMNSDRQLPALDGQMMSYREQHVLRSVDLSLGVVHVIFIYVASSLLSVRHKSLRPPL